MNTENTSVIKQLQEENTKLVEEAKQLKENLKWNVDEVVRYAHVLEEDYVLRSDDVTEHPDFVDIATDWYERHVWMVDKDEHAKVVVENEKLKKKLEGVWDVDFHGLKKCYEMEQQKNKELEEENDKLKIDMINHTKQNYAEWKKEQETLAMGLVREDLKRAEEEIAKLKEGGVRVLVQQEEATKGDPVIYQGKKVDYCEWYTDESEIPEKHRHMFDPCDLCGRLWDRDNLETTYDDTMDEEEYETEWACYECRPQT